MDYTRNAVRGAAIVFAFSLLAAVFGYFIRVILARQFTSEEYGLFYAIFSIFSFIAIFTDLGMHEAIVKYIPEFLHQQRFDKLKGLFLYVGGIQLSITLVMVFFFAAGANWLATHYFHAPQATPIIQALSLFFLVYIISRMIQSGLQGFQNMTLYSICNTLRIFLVLCGTIILIAFLGKSLLMPAYAYAAANVITILIFAPLLYRLFPSMENVKALLSKAFFGDILRFSSHVMISTMGMMVLLYTDTIVLTYFRTLQEVGFYQAAQPTANLLLYLAQALATVILPLSSELWAKKEQKKLEEGMGLLYKYVYLAIIPLSLLFAVFSDTILLILFGKEYLPAVPALQILSITMALYTISLLNTHILSGIGKPNINTKIIISAAVFNAIANIIVIPYLGIVGAALTTFLGNVIILIASSIMIRREAKIRILTFPQFVKMSIGGIVFFGISAGLKQVLPFSMLPTLVLSAIAGGVAYVVYLLLTKTITRRDLHFLFQTIKSILPKKQTIPEQPM